MTTKFYLPVGNGMNREFVSLGETLWYNDEYERATKCIVDAVEPGRVWVTLSYNPTGRPRRVFFENHELGRLRSSR